jgi:hypothetical protein
MAKYPEESMPNGALIESHEYRIQRVESTVSELGTATARNEEKLEGISKVVNGIDGKLDGFTDALKEHVKDDDAVSLDVRDLKEESKHRKAGLKNREYAFWTAIAAIVADVAVHIIEYLPKILGH